MKLHHTYRYFRTAWDREAAHHLTLARVSPDPVCRMAAALTLCAFGVPLSGAAPTMGFLGLKFRAQP